MTKYEKLVNVFQDNLIIAVMLLILAVIMAIPSVRDGIVCLWHWIRPKRKPSPDDPFEIKYKGETVTFDELVRSTKLDIVRVNAHTHMLGVMAEHAWVRKRYPGSDFRQQSLWFLESDTKNPKDRKAFDIIIFKRDDGATKEIYFEINSFFDGKTSSNSSPSEFARKKLREVYGM